MRKFYYDRTAKLLPILNVGDSVIFKKIQRSGIMVLLLVM